MVDMEPPVRFSRTVLAAEQPSRELRAWFFGEDESQLEQGKEKALQIDGLWRDEL
jgi:hypothetical protein